MRHESPLPILALAALMTLLGCASAGCRSDSRASNFQEEAAPPEDSWYPIGITKGKVPVRVLISKFMWRRGSEALMIERPEEVRAFHSLFAGNQIILEPCGYHWMILFEYEGGEVESLGFNEGCTTFRYHDEELWKSALAYFERAISAPSHFLALVELTPGTTLSQVPQIAGGKMGMPFPFDLPEGSLLLASREPWTPERLSALRALSPLITNAQLYNPDSASPVLSRGFESQLPIPPLSFPTRNVQALRVSRSATRRWTPRCRTSHPSGRARRVIIESDGGSDAKDLVRHG